MVLDTIIVGAGAMGSATAYWLSKYQDVALIDQFDFLHTNGSSHGQSRVIRKTYKEQQFAKMMPHAYDLWSKIQQETGRYVYTKTGGLDFGHQNDPDLKHTLNVCESQELPHELLSASEINNRFSAYNLNDEYYGIYQNDTGILNANRAIDMFQQQSAKQGAQLLSNSKITNIITKQDSVIIETNNGSYEAMNLVITAGSWINQVLSNFDLKVETEIWKITFAYWKVLKPELFQVGKFPIFINWAENTNYGFPVHERPQYIKIGPHVNDDIERVSTNDGQNDPNQNLLDDVSDFISRTYMDVELTPSYVETCLYTMTPDENFIIDHLPDNENIFVAGGFSGHGFKFTPLIGQIMQKLVMKEEINHDLSYFKLDNFLV